MNITGSNHGKGGRMPLEKADMQTVSKRFVQAGGELGYAIRDPNTDGPLTDGNFSNLYLTRIKVGS